MMKKGFALVLALCMVLSLAACGSASSSGQASAGSAPSDSAASDSTPDSVADSAASEESAAEFPVPTEGDPEPYRLGFDMTSIVPEGCTKVVNEDGLYLYMMPSEQTGETMVNYINETVIPAIAAISDQGACVMDAGIDSEERVRLFSPYDSYGYSNVDGVQKSWCIADGEQAGTEWLLSANNLLLNVYHVRDGVLYNAITTVKKDGQALCVTLVEDPLQNFKVVE